MTGAGRGLGLALTHTYLTAGDHVFAAVREPARATGLDELAARFPERLVVVPMDVGDAGSIRDAHALVRQHVDGLDVLVNNAALYSAAGSSEPDERLGALVADDALWVLRVNAVGPLLVAERFLDLLLAAPAPKVVTISSCLGSVSGNTGGFPYYYAASKAAANMYLRTFATDPATDGVVTVLVDPGDMRTDMNDAATAQDPGEVAAAIVALAERLTAADNNRFLLWDGTEQAW